MERKILHIRENTLEKLTRSKIATAFGPLIVKELRSPGNQHSFS